MTVDKNGGLVHCVAECTVCGKTETYYLKAREWARNHCEETGHTVNTEEGISYTYRKIIEVK